VHNFTSSRGEQHLGKRIMEEIVMIFNVKQAMVMHEFMGEFKFVIDLMSLSHLHVRKRISQFLIYSNPASMTKGLKDESPHTVCRTSSLSTTEYSDSNYEKKHRYSVISNLPKWNK